MTNTCSPWLWVAALWRGRRCHGIIIFALIVIFFELLMMPSKTKWTINIKTWTSKSYQQKWSWLFECCCDYLEEREEGCKQSAKVLKSQCYNISILIKDALIWEDDIKQGCFDMRRWEREMRNPAEEKWPAHNWFGVIGLLEQRPCTCHHHH